MVAPAINLWRRFEEYGSRLCRVYRHYDLTIFALAVNFEDREIPRYTISPYLERLA